MATKHGDHEVVFRVIDAMDAPLGGRIVRLRVLEGRPTVKSLKGAALKAISPRNGAQRVVRIRDFSIVGGRPSDRRIAESGRCDLLIEDPAAGEEPIEVGWELRSLSS
ncbi:MAG: hypothetical protein HY704_14755 [Gemmatimonadetes bacterium]|nr:hypothetical protein [Gemmatimonadota bacterium]